MGVGAMEIAAALDTERQENGPRGPMHGIPVILKANIDTADQMETTAGSLALKGHRPPDDAFVVKQLRKAGAVILGKANLSEWANFRSDWSSSGWSSIGGQTKNPYDLARNPCGSSSGSAVSVDARRADDRAIGLCANGHAGQACSHSAFQHPTSLAGRSTPSASSHPRSAATRHTPSGRPAAGGSASTSPLYSTRAYPLVENSIAM